MIEPIQRERIVAAVKTALSEVGMNISECGRRVKQNHMWLSSALSRVREGMPLTLDTMRLIRTVVPKIEEHLKAAGWEASGYGRPSGRQVLCTRSTEHLDLRIAQLQIQGRKIMDEIAELEIHKASIIDMIGES